MSITQTVGTTTLDWLSRLPYFRGKGLIALQVLRLCKNVLPLPVRLVNGGRMWLGDDETSQALLTYWIGKYEKETVPVFLHCLSTLHDADAAIDIGANAGFYSILAARELAQIGRGTVHAFEPNPQVFEILAKNAQLNQFTNLTLNQMGLGNVDGELNMYLNPQHTYYGSLRPLPRQLNSVIRVPVTTLDTYWKQFPQHTVGLIKMDIEGAELDALQGAQSILKRDHPIILYEEYELNYQEFGYTTSDIRGFLRALEYTLYLPQMSGTLVRLNENECQGEWQNVLALPPDKILRIP